MGYRRSAIQHVAVGNPSKKHAPRRGSMNTEFTQGVQSSVKDKGAMSTLRIATNTRAHRNKATK